MTTTLARLVRMPAEQLIGELCSSLAIKNADDGQDQQPLADLQHGCGQLADRVLLLADDAFAFIDEANGNGVRDPVRCRFICVEDAVEHGEVVVILREERAREYVAEQQDDADDFVRLDASWE